MMFPNITNLLALLSKPVEQYSTTRGALAMMNLPSSDIGPGPVWVYGHQAGVWFWFPSIETARDAQTLKSRGYEPVPQEGLETHILALVGQFCPLARLEQGGESEYWARSTDLIQTSTVPVVLAFSVLEALQASAIMTNDGSKVLQRVDPLPPHHVGEFGLVVGDPVSRYEITALGKSQQKLHQRLGIHLTNLARRRQLHSDGWRRTWSEIQRMAQELAAEYWQFHRTLHSGRGPSPTVTNVFSPNGLTWGPTPMPLLGIMAAIANAASGGQRWTPAAPPFYTHTYEGGQTKISLRQPANPVAADTIVQSLWSKVATMQDLDADVVLALLAQHANGPRLQDGSSWITVDSILEYRGIEQKKHKKHTDTTDTRVAGFRAEARQQIIEAVERTSWLYVNLRQETKGKRVLRLQSRFMLIIERYTHQSLLGEDAEQPAAWRFKPGTWLDPFLAEGVAGRQFGLYIQQVLAYDPYHEKWEKRLARYFMIHLRIAAGAGSSTIQRSVEELMRECSLEPNLLDPEKTRQRFRRAMDRLVQDHLIAEWHYVTNTELPSRHWLQTWMQREIQVAIAPLLLEAGYEDLVAQSRQVIALNDESTQTESNKGRKGKQSKARTMNVHQQKNLWKE